MMAFDPEYLYHCIDGHPMCSVSATQRTHHHFLCGHEAADWADAVEKLVNLLAAVAAVVVEREFVELFADSPKWPGSRFDTVIEKCQIMMEILYIVAKRQSVRVLMI